MFLIGSESVTPFPQLLISANTIQNGADAVAIYQASDVDVVLSKLPEDIRKLRMDIENYVRRNAVFRTSVFFGIKFNISEINFI